MTLTLLMLIAGGVVAHEGARDLDEGWQYRWGDSPFNAKGTPVWALVGDAEDDVPVDAWHPISFPSNPPDREGRSNVWYRTALPDGEWRDPVLYVFSIDLIAEFYVNGRLVYRHGSFDAQGQGSFVGWPWHMIDLPKDFGGKTLYVRVWSNYYDIGLWGEVKLMERSDLVQHILDQSMVQVVVSGLSFILAVVACLFAVVQPLAGRTHLLIALFMLLAGFMVLAQSQASQFIVNAPMTWTHLAAATYFLLPIPMALLVRAMCRGWSALVVDWVWRSLLLYAVGAIGGSLAGVVELSDMYPVFDGLLSVSLIVLFVAGGLRLKNANLVQRVTFGGFIVFGLFLLIDMGVAHGVLPWTRMPLATGLLAFAVMLIGLSVFTFAHTERALRDLNTTLEKKVRDRTQDLERSNAELQQFASVISHDLQAPLRMISGHLALLARRHGDNLDEAGRAEINGAIAAARRMAAMIQGVLDYSRIESQGGAFRRVDTGAVLTDALADLKTERERTNATIEVGPLPVVRGDRTQVRRVFQNLIGNALKYRRADVAPHIRIDARAVGAVVVLSVTDNGKGIVPKDWADAMTLLRRLASSAEEEGTGLGLPICKRIVERHGGTMWMEPTHGGGLTVLFTLPADHHAPVEAASLAG